MRASYNGFSPKQRRIAGREINAAVADGRMAWRSFCSVCATAIRMRHQWHLEDYRDVLSAYPVCRRCHHAIHVRFAQTDYWQRLLKEVPVATWVHDLSVDIVTLTRPFDETYLNGLP